MSAAAKQITQCFDPKLAVVDVAVLVISILVVVVVIVIVIVVVVGSDLDAVRLQSVHNHSRTLNDEHAAPRCTAPRRAAPGGREGD